MRTGDSCQVSLRRNQSDQSVGWRTPLLFGFFHPTLFSLYLLEQYRLGNGLQLFALRRDRTEQILP